MQQLCLIHDKKAVNLPVSEHLPGKFPSTVAVRLPVHTVLYLSICTYGTVAVKCTVRYVQYGSICTYC